LVGERVAERVADGPGPRRRVRHHHDFGRLPDGGWLVVGDAAAPRAEEEREERGEDREASGHAGTGPCLRARAKSPMWASRSTSESSSSSQSRSASRISALPTMKPSVWALSLRASAWFSIPNPTRSGLLWTSPRTRSKYADIPSKSPILLPVSPATETA